MKFPTAFIFLIAVCQAGVANAQLQIVADAENQAVFGNRPKDVGVVWHNPGTNSLNVSLSCRLYQASSVTAMPLGNPVFLKELQVLPGQTLFDSISLTFPRVKAASPFLVQWLDASHQVLGVSKIMVYPANLLKELKVMVAGEPLGVFDPQNEIKPSLKQQAVEFEDLQEAGMESFPGRLAIVGPCTRAEPQWSGLSARIRKLSSQGKAVVWLQTFPSKREGPWPSFFSVPQADKAVVVAQSALADKLEDSPQSQLNLIYFCKLALHPETPVIPELSLTP